MKNWKLVFEDHFDGDKLDESVWTKEVGFIRKGEPQYFTKEDRNCFVENSNLIIRTIKEDYEGAEYTSASIITAGKKEWLYGRFEMRAKLPVTRSLWPAFWTMGANFFDGVDWPLCGEIDIMEIFAGAGFRNYETLSTVHFLSAKTNAHDSRCGGKYAFRNKRPLNEDYHVYAVEWDAEKMVFFFDKHILCTCEITDDMQGAFNKPHYIILNTSLMNGSNGPNAESRFPQDYVIDYIRVYQEA